MFVKVFVFCCLLAVVLSITVPQEPVPIVAQSSDVNPDGSFQWSFESADGISQSQKGEVKQIGEEGAQSMEGSVSWTDPEGGQHQLTYIADENGYRPFSSDVPVGPEVPAHVINLLKWIEAHPEENNL